MKNSVELPKGKQSRIGVIQSAQPAVSEKSPFVVNVYLKKAGYENVEVNIIEKSKCHSQMKQVMNKNYDLIFNMCDGGVME
jgi:ABC-type uncharacterized transport system substrate-binding protein